MKTFAEFQEGVAALAVGGSKVVPALMTGIGAAGMIMQSRKKKDSPVPRDDQGMPDPLARLGRKAKVTLKKGMKDFKKEVKRSAKDISKGLKAGKDIERTSATGRINVVQQELQKKAASGDKNAKEMLKKFGKRFKENIRRNRNMDEGVTALAVGGSKVVPALMTGIGAVGTIMQARKYKTRNNPSGRDGIKRKDKREIGNMEKRLEGDRNNDMIIAKPGEAKKQNKLIDKYIQTRKEEVMAAPTNNVGDGKIAGTVEAGDNPPVKKKKRYIYGGTGSRKMWMTKK